MLSVIVPMYDEHDVLPAFGARLRSVLDGLDRLGGDYEVIAVDDGSRGATPSLLDQTGPPRHCTCQLDLAHHDGLIRPDRLAAS